MADIVITRRERDALNVLEGREHVMTRGLNVQLWRNPYPNASAVRGARAEELLRIADACCVQTWQDENVVGKSVGEQLAESPTGKGSVYYAVMHELMRRYGRTLAAITMQDLQRSDSPAKFTREV